jgi:CHAT domain-containing protein
VDLLHFVCHGAACKVLGIQSLYLESGQFTSLQLKGIERSKRLTYPFVFLNACEVGRLIPTLAGVGGFASEFIDRGAMGVVAPLWSVKDGCAHEVAIAFYDRIRTMPPLSFAEIIRQIRSRAYSGPTAGEDTYAAYCFYGDPLATAQ